MQHEDLVNHCERIAKHFGAWKGWANPIPSWGKGEHPDWFGVFNRQCDELWRDNRGESVKCEPGDTIVLECKVSRSDFDADHSKPWRDSRVLALGAFRFYVAPLDTIDAHRVRDPWGLIEVDDAGAPVMTKPAMRVNLVATGKERMLMARLIDQDRQQAVPGKVGGGKSKPVQLGELDAIEGLLAQKGSLPIGRIKRLLGITTQADRLADLLNRDVRFTVETDGSKSLISLAAETQEAT